MTIAGLFSCALGGFAFADKDGSMPSLPALVEVDGVKLTLGDYQQKHPGGLFQAYNTFYQSERKVIDEFVDEYLLERQAKKENITVTELLDRHVNSAAAKDPPEDALRVYYEGVETNEPYEAVRDQIIARIREVRTTRARAEYLKSLRTAAHISIMVGPPRAQVALKDAPLRGEADAPVAIVEYADYECPYCQQTQPAIDRIEAEYKGKIAFSYKDIPLPMHTHAQKAAEAAHCAGVQGKYWEYHDMLFKTRALEVPQLKEHARDLKLDMSAFDKCLDSGEQAAKVNALSLEGQGFGLQGTPSFFINGRFISGGLSYEQLKSVIDEELVLSSKRGKETAKKEQ